MTQTRLFSYKMTSDTGFAPNPFHGFIRQNYKPGIHAMPHTWTEKGDKTQKSNKKCG